MKWLSRLVILGAFAVLLLPVLSSISSVSAELTEAEKQAIEQAREAEQQAAEGQQDQQAPEPTQAPEPPQGGQDQGGNVATDRLNGRISAIGTDTLSVGIIGNNTFTVTGRTYITYNGQISNLPRLFMGDTVSVQFDSATNEAIRIEVEGFGFPATYQDTGVTVTYIGWIGHWLTCPPKTVPRKMTVLRVDEGGQDAEKQVYGGADHRCAQGA